MAAWLTNFPLVWGWGGFLVPLSSEPDIFETQERGEGITDGLDAAQQVPSAQVP